MIRTFTALLLFNLCFIASDGINVNDDSDITRLHDNIVKNILSNKRTNQRPADFLSKLNNDGSFSDVNYLDKTNGSWQTQAHLSRLLDMAIDCKLPQSRYYNNPELKKQVFKVLDYWLKNDFSNPNWWWMEIGIPQTLAQAMILLQDELSPEEMQQGLKILNRATIKMTGQNKVWLSGNVVYRSLLTRDSEMIRKAANSIADEITVTEEEGIQPDFSFHQHGHQIQFGNYGLSYASDMVKWASIFEGTEFAFSQAKIEILRNYLRNGLRWVVYNRCFDLSACGRQLFHNAQISKARTVAEIFEEAQAADPSFAEKYKKDLETLEGNRMFWRSDYMVHRRKDFYASVKMSSKRVKGYEVINGENIQGYHTGDGATVFYQSGDEYQEIFPFWDWKKIPGISAFQDRKKLPQTNGLINQSDFVGGVSDGKNGIAAMIYNRDGLIAHKSWFCFDDAIICLGAGIKSDLDKDVATTINQSLLNGKVSASLNGKMTEISEGMHSLEKVNWVIHDNWGYFFPGTPSLKLENKQRKGAWNRVVAPMSSAEMTADIFQLWLDQGSKPGNASYAYFVFPTATKENIREKADAIKIIANEEDLQAVMTKDNKLTGIVFYREGMCKPEPGQEISADTPCVVLLASENKQTRITVADPTHLKNEIKLTISGNFKASGDVAAAYNKEKNNTTFKVQLPAKGEAGESVIFTIR